MHGRHVMVSSIYTSNRMRAGNANDIGSWCVVKPEGNAAGAGATGSAEEEEDLRAAYLACEGDMGGVLDRVPCASVDSEDRLRALLQRFIDSDQLPAFRAFTHETKAKKAARKRHVSGSEKHKASGVLRRVW